MPVVVCRHTTMSIDFIDKSTEARLREAIRACCFAVVDRFNTEDPFWSGFVTDPERTTIGDDRFSLTLLGQGVELEVIGSVAAVAGVPGGVEPSVRVGGRPSPTTSPLIWHSVDCTVDGSGRFVTKNFRRAIEASIGDLSAGANA